MRILNLIGRGSYRSTNLTSFDIFFQVDSNFDFESGPSVPHAFLETLTLTPQSTLQLVRKESTWTQYLDNIRTEDKFLNLMRFIDSSLSTKDDC